MRRNHCLALALIFSVCLPAFAVIPSVSESQAERERESKAVVRNKRFYKQGRIEFAGGAGLNPFDLALSNQMFYARATWHITDIWGWEIANAFFGSPRETQWAVDLVREKGISNLQFTGIKWGVTTNVVWTPIYSKIRLWGASVLYWDGFAVLGGGVANTQLFTMSSPGLNQPGTLSVGQPTMEPCINIGIGFRFYFNRTFAFIVDLRNYLLYSTTYGSRSLRSNYMTNLMLSVML
jgi:outer membrane beta-barrel protein